MIPGKSCGLQVLYEDFKFTIRMITHVEVEFLLSQTEVRVIKGTFLTADDVLSKHEGL